MRFTIEHVLAHISTPLRVQVLAVGFLALVLTGALLTDPVTPERARLAASSTAGQHTFRQFTTNAAFSAGTNQGTRVARGSLTIGKPVGRLTAAGRSWSWARWTSGWVRPASRFTQLIPSWNVVTPANTAVQVQARVRSTAGTISRFKTVATWSSRDDRIRRTSGGAQRDSVARLDTDTIQAVSGVALNGYQLRVLPLRTPGTSATPTVRALHAVASRPATQRQPTSRPLYGGRTLAVPRYSQMTHRGQYPQYGGGGQAWCSPTSLSMILGYYRALPTRANYAWVTSPTPTRGSTTSPAWSTTTATRAPATGPSTRRTPPCSPATPSSPVSPACARPSASSPPASRSPPRSPSPAASSPARRSAPPRATSS